MLRKLFKKLTGRRRPPTPVDLASAAVLFAALLKVHYGRAYGREAPILCSAKASDGEVGVFSTLWDFSLSAETEACQCVDFTAFGECWMYWLEDEAEAIYRQVVCRCAFDSTFHPMFRHWLSTKGVPMLPHTP
jgi:succinate-acetate transporter protein